MDDLSARLRHTRLACSGLAFLGLSLFLGSSTQAQDAGPGDALPQLEADASSPVAPIDPRVAQLRALLAGTLDVQVSPQSLFEVPLDDEGAIQVERVRLQTFLQALEVPPPAPAPPVSRRKKALPPPDAGEAVNDAGAVDQVRWQERLELDRARLDFYRLEPSARAALLQQHAARQQAARPVETAEQRRVREAEVERQEALEAAREARSEAERIVSQELAYLIGVEKSLAQAQARFQSQREALVDRRDSVLGWRRRVQEAKAGSASDADAAYEAIRRSLRASRDELDLVLTDYGDGGSTVPALSPDPLVALPPDVPGDQARERRTAVASALASARNEEEQLLGEQTSALMDEIDALNHGRLDLLAHLSRAKRAAVTGFSAAGLDQARAEARHLVLILRYHRRVATTWIQSWRGEQSLGGISVWGLLAVGVPWLMVGLAFLWWRRRSPGLLTLAEDRLAEFARVERRTLPTKGQRVFRFLRDVRRPLEWLALFGVMFWLLPTAARQLLEVQLLAVIVGWTLGGAFIVNAINALAMAVDAGGGHATDSLDRLRLRSLRLVGGVVVVIALILVLSVRLVGEGTIYSWVLSTCWLAALPVFLILVRWWRDTVFKRVDRARRKSKVQGWVLANREGWQSFLAAMVAAVLLFSTGVYRAVRNWIGSFDLARRAHAYLFKREIDRLSEGKPKSVLSPLSGPPFDSLAPDRCTSEWLGSPGEEHLQAILLRVREQKFGIIAVVGPQGAGKSTLLTRLSSLVPEALALDCEATTSSRTLRMATQGEEANEGASLPVPPLVLLDDAHSLFKPLLGGLKVFDEALAYARTRASSQLWVFAIDEVLWPFLRRARDARPLFDEVLTLEPWTDLQIGELLSRRSWEAGIEANFEDLLEELPPSADEIDRQEALVAKRNGYYRMVWDYARGNPAIALEVWRSSLAEVQEGVSRVRPLQAPNPARLESLPDSALFILRAVLQMSPASVSDVAVATRLSEDHVESAFRFGQAHGYLVESAGRVRVSWPWIRSVILFLERRHLLVNS